MRGPGRLFPLLVLLAAVTAAPVQALAAPKVSSEQTVLSKKNGQVYFFDQLTLSSGESLSWPVPAKASALAVQGARVVSRTGGLVVLAPTSTSVALTYRVPIQSERFIWSRPVPIRPSAWVVLVGAGLQAGFVRNLPFTPDGEVTIAGQNLAEYTYVPPSAKGASFAWPFLASGWPARMAAVSWGAVAVVLLLGLWGARRFLRSSDPWG